MLTHRLRTLALACLGALLVTPALAQTARVQIIHNSPDPAAATVDIYVNGDLTLDDFAFRTATPFLDLPAEVELNIGVAPGNSSSASDALATIPITLEDGSSWAYIATGVLDPSSFAANPSGMMTGFQLESIHAAREMADEDGQVSFNVFHGSPDAAAVNVVAVGVGEIITDQPFTRESGYITVPPAAYTLEIQNSGDDAVLATYNADLSGLAGGAAIVAASGFLNPAANQGGEAFGLLTVLPDGTTFLLPLDGEETSETARVQVIHNAPDPAAAIVDIYLDGDLAIDDFAFRTATPYLDLPANETVTVGVAPGNSESAADVIVDFSYNLDPGTYALIASGVLDPAGFAANPSDEEIGFTLLAQLEAQEAAADHGNVEFYVVHGSPDAPAVDVIARGVGALLEGVPYSGVSGYLSVPADLYTIDIGVAGTDNIAASFTADLSGLGGGAAAVLASGFLDPAANQDGEAFGLLAVLPDGTAFLLPAAEETETARVQVIHNAADPAAEMVDVYINDALAIDDFMFRTATPFLDLPAGEEIVIGIAPPNSTVAGDAIATFPVTLDSELSYTVVANGVLDPSGFAANPSGEDIAFTLLVATDAQEASGADGEVALRVVHGATDAPAVDVAARGVGDLLTEVPYSAISGYLNVPTGSYTLDIQLGGTEDVVASFAGDLSGLGGGAATVLASGFLDPSANQDGAAFGLLAVLPDGGAMLLPSRPTTPSARVQVIHNAADPAAATVDVYINDGLAVDDFAFRTATPFLDLPAGEMLTIGIAPPTSTAAGDAIATFDVELIDGESYTVVANGVLDPASFALNPSGQDIGFTLLIATDAQEAASNAENVAIRVVHGSTDAPAVDVFARGVAELLSDVPYSAISGYLEVPADAYTLNIEVAETEAVAASFFADVSTLGGGAATVLASGFLDPAANQNGEAFALLTVLPDGTAFTLPVVTNSEADQAGVPNGFRVGNAYPNPFNPTTNVVFDLPERANVNVELYNVAGQRVLSVPGGFVEAGTSRIVRVDAANLPSGLYVYRVLAEGLTDTFAGTGRVTLVK